MGLVPVARPPKPWRRRELMILIHPRHKALGVFQISRPLPLAGLCGLQLLAAARQIDLLRIGDFWCWNRGQLGVVGFYGQIDLLALAELIDHLVLL